MKPKDYHENIFMSQRSEHFFEIYLGSIGRPEDHINDINIIRRATEADLIHIYINGPGGYVDTGLQYINAMRESRAKVVTILDGAAASMCGNIFLAGHEMIVQPYAILMLHDMLHAFMHEKGIAVVQQSLDSYNRIFDKLIEDYIDGFLTKQEIQKIKDGSDFYLEGAEIIERLNKRYDSKNRKEDVVVEKTVKSKPRSRKRNVKK